MVEETEVTHDNNGRFYRIKMDLAKEGSEIWDLTPYFKGRVGDNRFGLQVVWTYQGRLLDTTGMKPYIEGNVGNYSFDDKKDLQLAPDAATVRYTGNPSDCQSGGRVTYYFPEQMFPREGIFKGYIGLLDDRDDSSQPHISGVTVWFRVLPGIAQMGHACDVYISDLDKAITTAQEKLRQADNDFSQTTATALQDLQEKYNKEVAEHQGALLQDTKGLEALAAETASLQAKIKAEDLITESQYNEDRKYIVNLVETQLANLSNSIEYLPNADAIKNKYPHGEKVFAVAADTGHKWIYYNDQWQDCGVYDGNDFDNNVLAGYGTLFYDDKHTPEKYQDLNTLDINRIYGYSDYTPKNAPTNSFNGFVIDQSYKATGAELQIAVDVHSHNIYFRSNWGDTGFNSWVSLPDNKNSLMSCPQLFYDNEHTPEKYQDLNTLDINRIYGYSGCTPKNAPVANFNGQVITFGFDPSRSHLVTQIAHAEIDVYGNSVDQWYERHSWGTSDLSFSEWKRIDSFNGIKSYGELFSGDSSCPDEYKDLDTLPLNTIFGYDQVDDLKHSVPGLNFNGLIYNLSYIQGTDHPFVQYAICKDDYGPIIAYRNYWSNKLSPWIVDNKAIDFYVDAKNQTTDAQHFTKLVDAMWATQKTQHPVVIHVSAGTYDMYQEYGGEDCLKKLNLHTDSGDFKTEMPMLSNVTIIGEGDVKLTYMPDLNTAEKYPYAASIISPINVAGKFKMKNVDIEAQYGRYCIHDETSGNNANFYKSHEYMNVNCVYHQSLANTVGGQAYGGGFDNGQSYLFKNCSFKSEAAAGLSFHNRDSCGGNFIFDNCYFSGKNWSVRFGNVGQQTKSKAKFSSCYFAQKIYVNVEALSIESTNAYALTLNNCNATAIDFDSNLKEQSYQPKIYNALGSVDKTVSPTPTANIQPTSGTTPTTPQAQPKQGDN